jgi:SAM-dependent methyltransferase
VLFEDRSRAQSFGAAAERYDRARPSYPPALLDALLAGGAHSVLDVGCGTGIAAALLADRGCAVLGVEVDARMAELARAKGLEVEVARFEDWQTRGRRFDLLTSAQAWHWIDPVAGAARAAQALRPGGWIAVFWNLGDPPQQLRELLSPIYARLAPGLEEYSVLFGNRDARAQSAMAGIVNCGAFADPQGAVFAWSKRYDTAAWLEHITTHSDHQALAQPQRERLLAAVGEAIGSIGGSFRMPYHTVLVSAERIGGDRSSDLTRSSDAKGR